MSQASGGAGSRPPRPLDPFTIFRKKIIELGNITNIKNCTFEILHFLIKSDKETDNFLSNVSFSNVIKKEFLSAISDKMYNSLDQNVIVLNDFHISKIKKILSSSDHLFNQNNSNNVFQYNINDKSPYSVFVESTDNKNIGQLSFLKLGKLFFDNKIKCNKLDKRGRNRVAAYFNTSADANNFINNKEFLEKNNLKTFIPAHAISCKALIRGVDPDMDVSHIINHGKNIQNINILNARRIKRKYISKFLTVYQNTPTVIVTFRGQVVPESVQVYSCWYRTERHQAPVTQCFNCLRYGHTSRQCRSGPRCYKCGSNHISSDCTEPMVPIKCIFCAGNHWATEQGTRQADRVCKEFLRQFRIKEIMSLENISFFEASAKIPSISSPLSTGQNVNVNFSSSFPRLSNFSSSGVHPGSLPSTSKNNIKKSYSSVCQSSKFTKIINKKPKIANTSDHSEHMSLLISPNGRDKSSSNSSPLSINNNQNTDGSPSSSSISSPSYSIISNKPNTESKSSLSLSPSDIQSKPNTVSSPLSSIRMDEEFNSAYTLEHP